MASVNIERFAQHVDDDFNSNSNTSILGLGLPGVGKSTAIQDVASNNNSKYVDVRLLLWTETETKGIPSKKVNDDGTAFCEWLQNDFLPRVDRDGERGILILDEFSSAPPKVKTAMYQLIYDRKLGDYILPAGWLLVALGNREVDGGVYYEMPPALINRFKYYEIEASVPIFKKYCYAHEFAEEIPAFLSMQEESIHTFKPNTEFSQFASPRSWEVVSNSLKRFKERGMLNLLDNSEQGIDNYEYIYEDIASAIGDVSASELLTFCKFSNEMPNTAELLKGILPKDEHGKPRLYNNEVMFLAVQSCLYSLQRDIGTIDTSEYAHELVEKLPEDINTKCANFLKFLLSQVSDKNTKGVANTVSGKNVPVATGITPPVRDKNSLRTPVEMYAMAIEDFKSLHFKNDDPHSRSQLRSIINCALRGKENAEYSDRHFEFLSANKSILVD